MDKVLKNQKDAEILDCATKGAVIPDFLLQYEESDWNFLVRLASHFHTFMVPDCRAAHGRAYFGIPDLGAMKSLQRSRIWTSIIVWAENRKSFRRKPLNGK